MAPYRTRTRNRTRSRWRFAASVVWAAAALGCAAAHAQVRDGEWKFDVLLDGTPVGQHTFSVAARGGTTEVRSTARFDVRLLFVTVYRYRHESVERWRGDCLEEVQATTDANGTATRVDGRAEQGAFAVEATTAGPGCWPGCVMAFAYWNPAMLAQSRLLNLQTGTYETVQVQRLGDEMLQVGATAVLSRRYRLSGTAQPIDLWYAASDQRWLALQSTVSGGKRLRYRLAN